jgi:hypothetical protein
MYRLAAQPAAKQVDCSRVLAGSMSTTVGPGAVLARRSKRLAQRHGVIVQLISCGVEKRDLAFSGE